MVLFLAEIAIFFGINLPCYFMQATSHGCSLAKHRKSSTLESKDLLLHLGMLLVLLIFEFQPNLQKKNETLHVSNFTTRVLVLATLNG